MYHQSAMAPLLAVLQLWCSAHLLFNEQKLARPHLFHNLPLPSWFYTNTHFVYPRGMTRQSWPERVRVQFKLVNVTHSGINQARCRITTLIETNAIPLHQTTNFHRNRQSNNHTRQKINNPFKRMLTDRCELRDTQHSHAK